MSDDDMYEDICKNIGTVESTECRTGGWCTITITPGTWARGLWDRSHGFGLNARDPVTTKRRNTRGELTITEVGDRTVTVRGRETKAIQPGDVLRPAWSDR